MVVPSEQVFIMDNQASIEKLTQACVLVSIHLSVQGFSDDLWFRGFQRYGFVMFGQPWA